MYVCVLEITYFATLNVTGHELRFTPSCVPSVSVE